MHAPPCRSTPLPQQRALTCHLPCSETCNVELTGSYLKKENGFPGASSHMVVVDGRVIKEYRERSVLTQRSYKSWRFTPDHCRSKSPRTHVGYVLRLGRSNLSAAFSNIFVTETKSSSRQLECQSAFRRVPHESEGFSDSPHFPFHTTTSGGKFRLHQPQ